MNKQQVCRSCGAPIQWGVTAKGKTCPYDVVAGKVTTTSHFATCPQATGWSKKPSKKDTSNES